jgi:hypothetical protein
MLFPQKKLKQLSKESHSIEWPTNVPFPAGKLETEHWAAT